MPDERLDSMQQGMGAPPESPEAQRADADRRADLRANPSPPMEGAMGGSNDADRAGDQADMEADLHIGLPDDRTRPDGGGDAADRERWRAGSREKKADRRREWSRVGRHPAGYERLKAPLVKP